MIWIICGAVRGSEARCVWRLSFAMGSLSWTGPLLLCCLASQSSREKSLMLVLSPPPSVRLGCDLIYSYLAAVDSGHELRFE